MDSSLAGTGLADAFDRAARRYDLLTGLNPGYHRHLGAAARLLAKRIGYAPSVLLDLGCGSGSSTSALATVLRPARLIGIDASGGMLGQARAKSWPDGVEFRQLSAEQLAGSDLPQADGAMAAYLMRNVDAADRDDVLADIRDALRPGGWLAIQEYSVAGRRRAQLIWTLICWLVVIPLSWLVNGSPRLYRYLWRSVLRFDSTDLLLQRLRRAGFVDVELVAVPGWQRGILHTVLARRPAADKA